MGRTEGLKNFWFIPKRANVHQMVALLHGIKLRKYHNKKWNTTKQDDLSLELKRLGATNTGKKIQPQGMRTLLASLHYLGFVYLDNNSFLQVTKAGERFYDLHKSDLKKIENLKTSSDTIDFSEEIYNQMKKLQITNPLIISYCEDILLFPFRYVLELLQDLEYLDLEELALIVFNAKDRNNLEFTKQEILNFRNLDEKFREKTVELFKETKMGNITLKKAPSAGYFMQLCTGTGYIDRVKVKPINKSKNISCIKIKEQYDSDIKTMLNYYKDTEAYDYGNDLELWIEYFGDPHQLLPPKNFTIINKLPYEVYIEVYKDDTNLILAEILGEELEVSFAIFENKRYKVKCFNIVTGDLLYKQDIDVRNKNNIQIIKDILLDNSESFKSYAKLDNVTLRKEVLEHSNAKYFSKKMLRKIDIIERKTGNFKISSNLRGAQYEFLFYLLLINYKNDGLIDEVLWNGKIGKYNLPVPAPGGKLGTADIIFQINDKHYILELTTIKSKSGQEKAELSSVPDHVRQYKRKLENNHENVYGIFIAPLIHERVDYAMKSNLQQEEVFFVSSQDSDFLDLIDVDTREELISNLDSLFH